jgi:predicted esterase
MKIAEKDYRYKQLCLIQIGIKHFSLIIISLFFFSCILEGKDKKMIDNIHKTYHSKTYPQCTFAIYREPSGYDENTVLYYFHGTSGNESSWFQASRGLVRMWRNKNAKFPQVVSVTFGTDWLLFPEKVSERGVHLETFVHDLIPEIEQQLGSKIQKRLLYGFSMGGANAAQLFFRCPQLFEKSVIVSPKIYLIPINASQKEIYELSSTLSVHNTGIRDWIKINILSKLNIFISNIVTKNINEELAQLQWNIQNQELWPEADILRNIKHAPKNGNKSVYISCGIQDGYCFFPGAELLSKMAAKNGYNVTFDILEGGHMMLNESHIVSFLEE